MLMLMYKKGSADVVRPFRRWRKKTSSRHIAQRIVYYLLLWQSAQGLHIQFICFIYAIQMTFLHPNENKSKRKTNEWKWNYPVSSVFWGATQLSNEGKKMWKETFGATVQHCDVTYDKWEQWNCTNNLVGSSFTLRNSDYTILETYHHFRSDVDKNTMKPMELRTEPIKYQITFTATSEKFQFLFHLFLKVGIIVCEFDWKWLQRWHYCFKNFGIANSISARVRYSTE